MSNYNFITIINQMDVEDLQYIERDLCYHELVSLGFLLYGAEHCNAQVILQKLLVLANIKNAISMPMVAMHKKDTPIMPTFQILNSDLLQQYASSINPNNWRPVILEALSIIGAKRVIEKLGFEWDELRQHYLPHIAALSLHVQPLLKTLYHICERMTPTQAKTLVEKVYEQRNLNDTQKLQFNDYAYMEIFMLDWLTRRIISVGDQQTNAANVEVLLEYFKFNEMDELKSLLMEAIDANSNRKCAAAYVEQTDDVMSSESKSIVAAATKQQNQIANDNNVAPTTNLAVSSELATALPLSDAYTVRFNTAGFILVINQREFYNETKAELKHLLPPRKLGDRIGTDIDKQRLMEVFTTFGYMPHECSDNLDHIELLHCIRETVKRSCIYDSLIVCILSHGMDGAVYGSNSIPVKIAEIEEIITANGTLQDKPKMLIIQACQKDDGPMVASDKKKVPTADAYVDVIKAMSTVPGYSSVRHTTTGTWFIQALCDAVHKFGDTKHMLDVLIAVTREVTNKRGAENEVMVPQTSFTLRKHFYLPRRL